MNNSKAYKHYKGNTYYVINEKVLHTETNELLVIYRDEKNIYARPYDMFHGYTEEGVKRFVEVKSFFN